MAIINKDKYLKDIASLVHKGVMDFELNDRPALEMGGRRVYVGGVAFDYDLGELTYTVQGREGALLPTEHGVRRLSQLDVRSLAAVSDTVRRYAGLRRERERNLVNVESRLRQLSGPKGPGMSL